MPLYCFTNKETGETIEEFFPMGKAPSYIEKSKTEELPFDFGFPEIAVERCLEFLETEVFDRDMGAEHSTQRGHRGAEWPIECYASGVNSSQANDLRAYFKERGVSCEVSNDGNPIYTDSNHRKRCLKVRGMHDRASFGT